MARVKDSYATWFLLGSYLVRWYITLNYLVDLVIPLYRYQPNQQQACSTNHDEGLVLEDQILLELFIARCKTPNDTEIEMLAAYLEVGVCNIYDWCRHYLRNHPICASSERS